MKVRYAVVGLGNIAQMALLPAFEHAGENSELVALISSDKTKLEELGRRHKVKHLGSYDDLEGLIRAAEVDAVYIALPNNLHREFTERAARAGAHVLCEKPMALTEEDCRVMMRACEESHVKLMIAYRLHFEEANLQAIEIVRSGVIGEPRLFEATFTQQVRPGDIRTKAGLGGGALFDLGVYCVNAARYVLRAEPTEVFAWRTMGGSERFRDVDEMTSATMRFPGDVLAQISVSQGAAPVSMFRVIGTDGDLRVEPAFEYSADLRHFLTVDGKTRQHTFAKRDQFAPELIYFSRCILENTEPEPSGEEGLADVRVLNAIMRSAESGQPVKLDPFVRSRRPDLSLKMRKPAVKEQKTVHAPSPSMK